MHASIVVLSALVAVTTGQFYAAGWGVMPYTGFNHALGVPMDEPAVAAAKMFNAQQHAIRGSPTFVVRKRREAPAPEAAAPADNAEDAAQPEKRQVIAYTAGLGYAGWSPYYAGWNAYSAYPFIYRKRRDTTAAEETPAQETSMEESTKEKRQIGYYGWGGLYSPLMRTTWNHGLYGAYPYLYRKRRDVSEQPEVEQTAAAEEPSKEKRQLLLGYAGWAGYPTMYSGYYPGWAGRSFLYRKRRDTDSQAAEENTSEDRSKRQFIYGAPLAYSATWSPYMTGYAGWGRYGAWY